MTEHVCEWILKTNAVAICTCGCNRALGTEEILARINATERLSAERVKAILEDHKLYSQDVLALHEYADILEGKDE